MNEQNNQYILLSVDKALDIIELFCQYEALSAIDVAKLTGNSKSTTFRMLTTLERRGFLRKNGDSKFGLGLKFYSIRTLMNKRGDLVDIIRPFLVRLGEDTGETCHLSIMSDDTDVLFLDKVLSRSLVKTDSAVGYTRPIYATSAGKAMLAFCPKSFVRNYAEHLVFEKFTPNSLKNVAELYSELDKIRQVGYACDDEEFEVGLTCFGAAILNSNGEPVAALCTSGPSARMNQNKERYLSSLLNAAKNASACFE